MKLSSKLGFSLASLLAIAVVSQAADAPKPDPKTDLKGVRLIKPYTDLKDLTADQTIKLKEIHKKYSDQIKALEAQQKDEMAAVLTDDQKKELAELVKTTAKAPKGKMKEDPATPTTPATPDAPKDTGK